MTDERYDAAARAAAQIVNIIDADHPKAIQFGKILFAILHAIKESEGLTDGRLEPSRN